MSAIVFSVGFLIFIAHLFASLFEKTRIPDVLPLVLIGLLMGPVTGLVSPDFFGDVGDVFISITLVIILFEGGIGLNFTTIRKSLGGGVKLTVCNFLFIVGIMMLASVGMGLSLREGMILGAILGGTSSAIVIPMVEKVRLQGDTKTMLVLESTFSDVLCIVVTLALIQSVTYHDLRPGAVVGQIIASFFLAAVIGGLFAFAWSSALSGIRHLENSIFLTPAFVFITYGLTEALGFSGAISSLAMGVTLGNIKNIVPNGYHDLRIPIFGGKRIALRPISLNQTEKEFVGEVGFLLKTFFFVYLGMSILLHNLGIFALGLIATVLVFSVRILTVRLSFDRSIPKRDASLAAVIMPIGLAAAVLATLPAQAGMEKGIFIKELVYATILFSIVATALLSFLMERQLIGFPYDSVFASYAPEKEEMCLTKLNGSGS
ncbi:MAG: cation:proton antiporter [Candidatus Altiarchaeota archaeon]